MCSLVMSLFSCDYIKTEIDQLKYQQCFNLLTCVRYSHSAWFLDGWTSILVLSTLRLNNKSAYIICISSETVLELGTIVTP